MHAHEPKAGRRLATSFHRVSVVTALAGLVVAGVFLRWAELASKNPADWAFIEVFVWTALAAIQILPVAGLLWAVQRTPPRSPRGRSAWMIWLVASVAELVPCGVLIGYLLLV